MSKFILIIMLLVAYVFSVHKLSDHAMAMERQVAGVYSASGNADAFLAASSQ